MELLFDLHNLFHVLPSSILFCMSPQFFKALPINGHLYTYIIFYSQRGLYNIASSVPFFSFFHLELYSRHDSLYVPMTSLIFS